MGQKRQLGFLDKVFEVEPWRERLQAVPGSGLAVPLKPSVRTALREQDVPVTHTADLFSNASHVSALELSDRLTRWFRAKTRLQDVPSGIHEAYREALVFRSRLVAHYCIWTVEVARNAVEKFRPEVLVASLAGGKAESCYCVEPGENWVGRLVARVARQEGLEFDDLATGQSGLFSRSERKAFRESSEIVLFLLRYGLYLWSGAVWPWRWSGNNSDFVLMTTRSYGLEDLGRQLKDACPELNVNWLRGPLLPSVEVPAWIIKAFYGARGRAIAAQKALLGELAEAVVNERELFTYRNVSFADLMAERIKVPISHYLVGLGLWSLVLDRTVDRARPRAVISCGNRDDDFMLGELCSQHGIPSILVSHGSHVEPKSEPERIEWGEHGRGFLSMPFSHLALATPLGEDYVRAFGCSGKVVRTGPLTWGKPANRNAREPLLHKWLHGKNLFHHPRVLLHAGTAKSTNMLRLYVYETPDEYIQSLCDLAEAVRKVPETLLVIKFRPTNELGVRDIETLVPLSERVVLEVDEPFENLLGACNLLVSFSSTTIEEAFQNRIPVLLYGCNGRYQHVPARELRAGRPIEPAAAYFVRQASDLPYAVQGIFDLAQRGTGNGKMYDPYLYPHEMRVPLRDLMAGLE